jgi:hypothetical protein
MHKTTIETMSDGFQSRPTPPKHLFSASTVTKAVHLIDGPTKQPRWKKYKCRQWAMIVGDDVHIQHDVMGDWVV